MPLIKATNLHAHHAVAHPRPTWLLLAVCCWLTAANAQWLERVLYLPDSLCGVTAPSLVVHNSVNNKVYVTGKYGWFTRNGRDCWIVVLDGATNQRIARIAVPSEVGCLEYNATDNKVYAASSVDSGITVIDGSADTVLHRVWFKSKVVGLFWERTLDKLYCGLSRDSSVSVLDAAADTVVATMYTTCGAHVFQASPEFGKLYCSEDNSQYLAIIDCTADTVIKTLHLQNTGHAMCYDSARQLVFCVGGSWVTSVDAAGDSVFCTKHVSHYPLVDVALGAHGAKLYGNECESLLVFDPVTLDITTKVRLGAWMSVMCHDPGVDRLFCTDGDNGLIDVVDCATDSVVAEMVTGVGPCALCLDSVASKVYSVNIGSDDVTAVDCLGDSVVATVAVGSRPTSLCYNHTYGKLYCTDSTNGLVSVISGPNHLDKNIWAGYGVTGICVGDDGAKVYCRVPHDSIVVAVDCATDSVVARIRPDLVPEIMLYVPERNRIYCGGLPGGQGTLRVIDCASDSVVATVILNQPPLSLCYSSAEDDLCCGAGEFDDVEVISCAGDSSLGFVAGACAQGPTLYCASHDKLYFPCINQLYIVDGAADTLLTTKTAVNGNVEGTMCLNTLQQKVYAPFQAGTNGSILVIDAASDSTLKTMAAESSWALCYDSINNTVYVSDGGNFGAVKVIDCVRDVVTTRIPVGLTPRAVAWNPDQNRTYVLNTWSGSISVLKDSFPSGIGGGTVPSAKSKPLATVIRGILFLPPASGVERLASSVLLDISGRKVLSLHEGANDVRSLSPGVYFVRERLAVGGERNAVHKVVLTR